MLNFRLNLPVSENAIGRWMEDNGAEISLSCSLGTFTARVSTKKLISYGDETGEHSEHRRVTRQHPDPARAVSNALRAAGAPLPHDP